VEVVDSAVQALVKQEIEEQLEIRADEVTQHPHDVRLGSEGAKDLVVIGGCSIPGTSAHGPADASPSARNGNSPDDNVVGAPTQGLRLVR
jgi:hypothetical protein